MVEMDAGLPSWLLNSVAFSDDQKFAVLLAVCVVLFAVALVNAYRLRVAERDLRNIHGILRQFNGRIGTIQSGHDKLQRRMESPAPPVERDGEHRDAEHKAAAVPQLGVGLRQLRAVMVPDSSSNESDQSQAAE